MYSSIVTSAILFCNLAIVTALAEDCDEFATRVRAAWATNDPDQVLGSV